MAVDSDGTSVWYVDSNRLSVDEGERMMRRLDRWLLRALEDGSVRVGDLPVLLEDEEELLARVNSTERTFPRVALHDLFVEQARRTPEAVAVEASGAAVSYAELELRSRAIATRLRAEGVDIGSRVGVCVDRSIELVARCLACCVPALHSCRSIGSIRATDCVIWLLTPGSRSWSQIAKARSWPMACL